MNLPDTRRLRWTRRGWLHGTRDELAASVFVDWTDAFLATQIRFRASFDVLLVAPSPVIYGRLTD